MTGRWFALPLVVFAACRPSSDEAPEAPPLVPVSVAKVEKADVAREIEAVGELAPVPGDDVKLGPTEAGWLSELDVAEGDRVRVGQVVARLDATNVKGQVTAADAALAQARTEATRAKAQAARTSKLVAAGVASKQEAEDARAKADAAEQAVRAAEAAVGSAEHSLGRMELRSPMAGVVARVFLAPGEAVGGAGQPVVEITRTSRLELRGSVSATDAALVRPGEPAFVTLDGLAGRVYPGLVAAVAPMIDPATGAVLVRTRIDNPGELKSGAFGRARIVVDVHHRVAAVPKEALVPDEEPTGDEPRPRSFAVMVVDAQSVAHRRHVELGYVDDGRAEVTSGLEPGQTVVVGNAYALPDGTKVAVQPPPTSGEGGR